MGNTDTHPLKDPRRSGWALVQLLLPLALLLPAIGVWFFDADRSELGEILPMAEFVLCLLAALVFFFKSPAAPRGEKTADGRWLLTENSLLSLLARRYGKLTNAFFLLQVTAGSGLAALQAQRLLSAGGGALPLSFSIFLMLSLPLLAGAGVFYLRVRRCADRVLRQDCSLTLSEVTDTAVEWSSDPETTGSTCYMFFRRALVDREVRVEMTGRETRTYGPGSRFYLLVMDKKILCHFPEAEYTADAKLQQRLIVE